MTAFAEVSPGVLPTERPSSAQVALWASAAVAALAVHVGAMALAMRQPEAAGDAPPAAIAIEIAPDAMAPNPEPETLIAPDMQTSMEVPDYQLETADIPEPPPPDTVPDIPPPEAMDMPDTPDMLPVAEAPPLPPSEIFEPAPVRPQQRPENLPPPPQVVEQREQPRREPPRQPPPSVQQQQAAVNAPQGQAVAAPQTSQGSTGVSPARWQSRLIAHLERRKRYPSGARSRREEGTAHVRFSIDRSGNVLSVQLVRSSGFAELDQEVLAMVRRASPVPAPPEGANLEVVAPVLFQIR